MIKGTSILITLLVFLPAVTPSAWRQNAHTHPHTTTAEPPWSEMVGTMDKMHAAMISVHPSGDSDVDFVKLMLPHHQAALDMAKTQLAYGKDPQMRRLSQEIITDQQSEIELMQLWLTQHGPASLKASQGPDFYASKEQ